MNTKQLLTLSFFILLFASPTTWAQQKSETFTHQVFFWLNNPETDLQSQLTAIKALGKLDGVTDFSVGVPAATPQREVVDHSYHIALTVYFETLEAHERYQKDQKHLQFIQDNQSKWQKVLVYDFTR